MSLNRRSFIGGMVAAVSAPRISAGPAGLSPLPSVSQGRWMNKGLVDAGGLHEPHIFLVRRGGYRLDINEVCAYQQSEELIRKLHLQGIEVYHTHLYKGFGMEAERDEMEQTRKAVEFAHSLGMKVDTYIQWNSMMYETFFAEEPAAVNWIQRDVAGLPILLPYGYGQSYRYRPCFANQNYLDYLKKVVRYAVVDVKTDFIHFDNFDLNAEPESCHCPACVSGFRNRLETKYAPAQLKERFGFSRIDFVNPPQWNTNNPPSAMKVVSDPAFQEWIDFRCQLMSDALQQIYDLVHSLNPQVALEINCGGLTGENHPWARGTDHARLLKFTRSFWSEEGDDPILQKDGRLISRVRSYKLASAYSNVMMTYIQDNPLALGESLAFNQTLGYLGSDPLSDVTTNYVSFYLKNRDCFEGAESAATVAILRPYASLTYNNADVQLCTVLAEQTLIEKSIPFDLIFDRDLHDLHRYRVVILPHSECLSDEQFALLKGYVSAGGSLALIGRVAAYDEWRRIRIIPALRELGLHDAAYGLQGLADPADDVKNALNAPAPMLKQQVGNGRVAYLPSLQFDGALPPSQPYFSILNEFWKLPRNWEELISLLTWAANGNIPLQLNAPAGVIADIREQKAQRRTFVHVLNYNAAEVPIQHDIHVQVQLPSGPRPTKATVRAPESGSETAIPVTPAASGISVSLPELRCYALLTIYW